MAKTNDNTLIKQMVARGEAVSTYTGALARDDMLVRQGKLVLVPLKCDNDIQKMDFVYAYSAKKQMSPIEKQFISALRASVLE